MKGLDEMDHTHLADVISGLHKFSENFSDTKFPLTDAKTLLSHTLDSLYNAVGYEWKEHQACCVTFAFMKALLFDDHEVQEKSLKFFGRHASSFNFHTLTEFFQYFSAIDSQLLSEKDRTQVLTLLAHATELEARKGLLTSRSQQKFFEELAENLLSCCIAEIYHEPLIVTADYMRLV